MRHGYRKHGVILLGFFLDDEGRSRLWLNPAGSHHPSSGAPQGMVVRAISTQKIRTYFMAQSCFVPSIWDVYDELLRSEGQDFCQVALRRPEGRMTFSQMLDSLAGEGVTLLAMELKRGIAADPLILNPKPGEEEGPIDLEDIKHLYVVGDTEAILRARGSRLSLPPAAT